MWDLRKLKCIATLKTKAEIGDGNAGNGGAVSFDPAGKYLAYTMADGSLTVTPVKEWDKAVTLKGSSGEGKRAATGIVWGAGATSITSCSGVERPVRFWERKVEAEKKDMEVESGSDVDGVQKVADSATKGED